MGRKKPLTLDLLEDVKQYSWVDKEIMGTSSWYKKEDRMEVSQREVGISLYLHVTTPETCPYNIILLFPLTVLLARVSV